MSLPEIPSLISPLVDDKCIYHQKRNFATKNNYLVRNFCVVVVFGSKKVCIHAKNRFGSSKRFSEGFHGQVNMISHKPFGEFFVVHGK